MLSFNFAENNPKETQFLNVNRGYAFKQVFNKKAQL